MPPSAAPVFAISDCDAASPLCVATSYDCVTGFEKQTEVGSLHEVCVDIDECALGKCGLNTICSNNEGSYDCVCDTDYVWNSWPDRPLTKGRLINVKFET